MTKKHVWILKMKIKNPLTLLGISDGHLHLDTGLDADGRDLLDNIGRGVQVDGAIVDAHLVVVPRLGALSAWGLIQHFYE